MDRRESVMPVNDLLNRPWISDPSEGKADQGDLVLELWGRDWHNHTNDYNTTHYKKGEDASTKSVGFKFESNPWVSIAGISSLSGPATAKNGSYGYTTFMRSSALNAFEIHD